MEWEYHSQMFDFYGLAVSCVQKALGLGYTI